MTIKIQAYQKHGIKCDELIDEFEFCCWKKLKEWLDAYSNVHACNDCTHTNEAKGCGKIERLPDGWGVACGEMTGEHQYLCKDCSQNVHKTNDRDDREAKGGK